MDAETLTVARVEEKVLESLDDGDRATRAYYIDERIYEKGSKLVVDDKEHVLDSDKIVVFVDEEPGKNWGHDCHYLLFDVHTGGLERLPARFPPSLDKARTSFRTVWEPTGIGKWALWG
jgi:hypothetical protein